MKKDSKHLRSEVVKEFHNGRGLEDLADSYKLNRKTILNWLKAADLEARREESKADELKRLRKEKRQLLEDKAILEKAAEWFAKRH